MSSFSDQASAGEASGEGDLAVPRLLVPNILIKNNFIDSVRQLGTGSGGSIVGGVPSYMLLGKCGVSILLPLLCF